MANIMDLLASYEMVELVGSAWQNSRFAATLRMPVSQADRLLAKYGAGWIYTQSALILRDTPYNRGKVAKLGKTFVIVEEERMVIRSPKAVCKRQSIFERRDRIALKQENMRTVEKIRIEIAERKVVRKRERLFHDCQMQPSPKRAGKGNSIADLGFFISTPKNPSMTKSEVKFTTIRPKGGLR